MDLPLYISKSIKNVFFTRIRIWVSFLCVILTSICLFSLSIKVTQGNIPFRILPCTIREIDHLPYLQRECVIQFAPGVPEQEKEQIFLRYGLTPIYRSPYAGFERVLCPMNQVPMSMVQSLRAEPMVVTAEPNYLAKGHLIPNDPLFRYQWNMLQIKADQAWNLTNALGVSIAVLDSGIAYENFDIYAQAPDLAGTTFIPGWDFVNSDANPDDDLGHGTHITGTIAQTTNNAVGCAGVAFGASIMPVKVLDNTGYGSLTNVVDGIYYAANNGVKILNMSFGFGNNPSILLQSAIQYADNAGCVLICSAGNEGTDLPNYPASYTQCISVSAIVYNQTLASYSNYGIDIDLCAPGGDLALDQNFDGYPDGILQQSHDGINFTVFDYFSGEGTSWSAAHVTGVTAMIVSVGGTSLTPLTIRNILETTAVDIGTAGWDDSFGWGLVDAATALVAAQGGATILSTSPLLPFTPILPTASTLPTAALAGYTIPFFPSSQYQNPSFVPVNNPYIIGGQAINRTGQWGPQTSFYPTVQENLYPLQYFYTNLLFSPIIPNNNTFPFYGYPFPSQQNPFNIYSFPYFSKNPVPFMPMIY